MTSNTLKIIAVAGLSAGIVAVASTSAMTPVTAAELQIAQAERSGPQARFRNRAQQDRRQFSRAGRARARMGIMGMLRGLDLSSEQREKLYDLMEPMREQQRQRFIDGPQGRSNEIRDLIASGELTKREASRIAKQRAEEISKRLVTHAEMLGEIFEDVLTEEQRQIIQDRLSRTRSPESRRNFRRGPRFQRDSDDDTANRPLFNEEVATAPVGTVTLYEYL